MESAPAAPSGVQRDIIALEDEGDDEESVVRNAQFPPVDDGDDAELFGIRFIGFSQRLATYICTGLFLLTLVISKFESFSRRTAQQHAADLAADLDRQKARLQELRREGVAAKAMINMLTRANQTTATRAQGELRALFQMLRRANDTSRITIQDLVSQLRRERRKTHAAHKALQSEKEERDDVSRKLRAALERFKAEKARFTNMRARVRTKIAHLTAGLRGFQQEMGDPLMEVAGVSCVGLECQPSAFLPPQTADGTIRTGFGPGEKFSTAQNDRLRMHLRGWAQVINGKTMRYECRNASVPRARFRRRETAKMARGFGTRDADSWHVCYDDWQPWKTGCLGISVGIGGEWGFEDGLAQQAGCDVYAFDPTEGLVARHKMHASDPEQRGRVHFEAAGLGGEVAQANTRSARYGSFDPNKTLILPLSALMERTRSTASKRATPIVDVLKIDCEGCEWTAFAEVARRAPNLLSRVRTILLEVHAIQRYGLQKSWEVHRLLDFLITHHGFRVYRSGFNKGWPGARNQIRMPLVQAGFPHMPCCWLLHLIRPASNKTWLSQAATATLPAPPYEFAL